ncbi:hypothetical protein X943_003990 [Babesia divergens]|uniref:Ubiquinol-cytochrome c chaperone domain-containing protein n=1 Tax=Babesia divergens TaxID=32595 RepID=A0AAD9G7Z8_BABDI|nr:hypothetical protein X943_003990 [Babesia divergens]
MILLSRLLRSVSGFPRLPLERYLLPVPANCGSMFFRLRRAFMDPFAKIHPFVLLALGRGECPHHRRAFGFEPSDEAARLLLGILHVWFLHKRMHLAGMDTEKVLIWEYLWSHMRSLLCAQEIHELDFRPNLEEMQHKTLGFCLALDESLDDYRMNNDLTTLKNILLIYFYKNDSSMLQSQEIDKLVKYTIAQIDFVERVPELEFRFAAFVL